jgi:hypothetical protein
MPEDLNRQSIVDEEHLKLLSIAYMVYAGLSALFSLYALIFVLIGVVTVVLDLHSPPDTKDSISPVVFGLIFGGIAFIVLAMAIFSAVLNFMTSRKIARRKSKTFCLVSAALSCFSIPHGTLLGVATFIVLGRKSVAELFEAKGIAGNHPPSSVADGLSPS